MMGEYTVESNKLCPKCDERMFFVLVKTPGGDYEYLKCKKCGEEIDEWVRG